MCNRTQNDSIWELIALFLTNQIAGNTIDFKMNVIKRNMASFRAEILLRPNFNSVSAENCHVIAKQFQLG